MKKLAFLLGLLSVGGQVLLLRELISSLNGNELFIGTALFGWLISVAIGAYIGGIKKLSISNKLLFVIASILLPVMIFSIRFTPLLFSNIPGEIIPFTQAAVLSIIAMIPIGIISGWLFTGINREGYKPSESIITAYLYEGIGAFWGGLIIASLSGHFLSTPALSIFIAAVTLVILFFQLSKKGLIFIGTFTFCVLIILGFINDRIDSYTDTIKYKPFVVEKSFDTHYGHQTILSRDSALYLITDNITEAAHPAIEQAENVIIPPLLIKPDAKNILYIGRAEFGLMQLCDSFPYIDLTTIDPRQILTNELKSQFVFPQNTRVLTSDPVKLFKDGSLLSRFDIVILNAGNPDNHRTARLYTSEYFVSLRTILKDDGLLYIPTKYDTERYILPEKGKILSILNSTIKSAFKYTGIWPGLTTAVFASDDSTSLLISTDSLISHYELIEYNPQYVNDSELEDRLNDLRVMRLNDAINPESPIHSINNPILPHYQALYRSRSHGHDAVIIPLILEHPYWLWAIAVLIIAFFVFSLAIAKRRRVFSLFIYFIAGLVSLSLELITFYLYQSQAGSLYSEMSILIGTFMLGLAGGTYYTGKLDRDNLEYPAILLLLTAAIVFAATFENIHSSVRLIYYSMFLFTTAAATGSLFTAVTRRYYFGKSGANRGTGYAIELAGSALGALLTLTILLPVIGLTWLLYMIIALLVTTLAGAIFSS